MQYKLNKVVLVFVMLLLSFVLIVTPGLAQEDENNASSPPRAEIVNDEGGPVHVTGSFTISSQNIIDSTYQAIIILEDQAGFIDRDLDYVFPSESQVIAALTSPYEVGTLTYSLSLPAQPQGGFRDVDQDDSDDTGVQVFAVALWDNRYYTVFLEEEDGTGWSTAWSSIRASINPETLHEYTGGQIIVWAPDDQQGFPSGFGEDGLLFTEDDPIVLLPAGYTLVDMDTDPFTFDRSRNVVLDLHEPDSAIPNDFSNMGYAEAFDALIDVAKREYAFTELKDIDWDALHEEFMPRFEEAEAAQSNSAYLFALRDFAWSIPDGHIQVSGPQDVLTQDFITQTSGGLGLSALELHDGRFLVSFILPGGPADQAGIRQLAELIEINGTPIAEAMQDVVPFSSPFSTQEFERVQQLRYLLSSEIGTDVEVTFQNPGAARPQTVTLSSIPERQSFAFSSILRGRTGLEPIIAYRFLEDNIGYVEVNDFFGNEPLLIETWEYFLRTANQIGSPGIIVDIRYNLGGFSSIGSRMASYFFTEGQPLYYREAFNPEFGESGGFFAERRFPEELKPPRDESLIYEGPLAVLIGQACASACELFAFQMGTDDRATFIGQYASQGIAGGWPLLFMPDGIIFAMPTSRSVDFDGNIIIEGVGIQPDIRVPIDEDTIRRTGEDLILEAAINYLRAASTVPTTDGGTIAIGESLEGELVEGERVRYTLHVPDAVTLDFLVTDETGDLDTYLRLYVAGSEQVVLENDDLDDTTVNSGLLDVEVPGGLTVIVEVGGYEDAESGTFTLTIRESGVEPEIEPVTTPEAEPEEEEETEGQNA